MLIRKNRSQQRRNEKFCLYVPGKMIRKFHVVVVERTSKKCTKTCNAPAELFFSCVNQLFIDVHGIVGAQLTRLEIPNARAKPATGQRGTLLIRTVPVPDRYSFRLANILDPKSCVFDSAYHAQNIRFTNGMAVRAKLDRGRSLHAKCKSLSKPT